VQDAVRKIFSKDPHKGVNPDEVVGVGAAIQGGVLGGEVKDILLLDVTPLTLSVETLGGVASPLIERNTTNPVTKGQIFSTATDGQTQVEIHVVQGERPMAANNKSLGKFILDGIPPAPRGVPQIEVTFDIDADGILNVTARDKATGREQHITITASSGLSDAEVENMVTEAEKYAAEDQNRREEIEVRNVADSAVYSTEKFIREYGDRLPDDAKKKAETAAEAVRKALESGNVDEIRRTTEALQQDLQGLGAQMYEAPPGAGPSEEPTQPGGGSPPPDEDVVDGEFTES
jgi:molecular chaperone DnaK